MGGWVGVRMGGGGVNTSSSFTLLRMLLTLMRAKQSSIDRLNSTRGEGRGVRMGGWVGVRMGGGCEHQQLLHPAADVVDGDEGEAELHRPPEQHTG